MSTNPMPDPTPLAVPAPVDDPEPPKVPPPAANLKTALLSHFSSELINRETLIFSYRTRIGFIGLVGPFIVLGSVIVATGGMRIENLDAVLGPLALIALCYFLIGIVGGAIEWQAWNHCNRLRRCIVDISDGPNHNLPASKYEDPITRHFRVILVYVVAYLLMLAAAVAAAYLATKVLTKAELSGESGKKQGAQGTNPRGDPINKRTAAAQSSSPPSNTKPSASSRKTDPADESEQEKAVPSGKPHVSILLRRPTPIPDSLQTKSTLQRHMRQFCLSDMALLGSHG